MEYRINRRTGDKISVIGMGASSISQAGKNEGVETLKLALDNGINYFDLAAGDAECFSYYGKAFENIRDKIIYQIHFGANYETGSYGWTTNLGKIKKSIAWQLEQLRTNYIDYGFIHCIDEESDWEEYIENGILDYIKELKNEGIVKHIGVSSHTPSLLQKILNTGLIDMVMFSINPGYDYHQGDYANGNINERFGLYKRCEAEGIGISVMKAFSGGQLLDKRTSPFMKSLTKIQCIQYALDKPGVLTVLPGIRNKKDLNEILEFNKATDEEKDYSIISEFAPLEATGKCVYCNHCKPCPNGLDIGLINKYYDLSVAGDVLAKDHYKNLEKTAKDCIGCGHCNKRCPFKVDQINKMKIIANYFGMQISKKLEYKIVANSTNITRGYCKQLLHQEIYYAFN